MKPSLRREWFERLYQRDADPWHFRDSPYEAEKYRTTLQALAKPHYRDLLELGCSIGELSHRLLPRCDRLTAVDTSATALQLARQRCRETPKVRFVQAHLPEGDWQGRYNGVVLSEILYYLDADDLRRLATRLRPMLSLDADLVLVHWLGQTDYPLTADRATEVFVEALGDGFRHESERHEKFRLDRLLACPAQVPWR